MAKLVALIVLALLAAGCGDTADTSSPVPTKAPVTTNAPTSKAPVTTAAPSTSLKTLINKRDENSEAATSDPSLVNLPASQLIAPLTDWDVTDYALSFTWQRQNYVSEDSTEDWSIDTYQLQVSRTDDFLKPELDVLHDAPGQDTSKLDPYDSYDSNDEEFLELLDSLRHWTQSVYTPDVLLEAGEWYWRVRAADLPQRPWSDAVRFHITTDDEKATPIRPLSPESPLFSFDMYNSDSGEWGSTPPWAKYWQFFPEAIQAYVAFAVPHEHWGSYDSPARGNDGEVVTYADFIQPLTDEGIPVLIKTGGPDCDFQCYLSTTELENLYRNNPNVLGVVTGENTWQFIAGVYNQSFREDEVRWFKNVIRISAKYGRYVIAGEGAYAFAWDKFFGRESPVTHDSEGEETGDYEWLDPDFLRENRNTFIPSPKSNIFWSYHEADSAVLGAWLSDLVAHQGIWAEAWYWSDAGFSDGIFEEQTASGADFTSMPVTFWLQTMLMGVSKGAVVYHFGGESGVTEDRGIYDRNKDAIVEDDGQLVFDDAGEPSGRQYTSFWDMAGNNTLGLERYIIPFIEAVTDQGLIPAKQEVLSQVEIAIDPGPVESDKGNFVCYGRYSSLYRATYGIRDFVETDADTTEDTIVSTPTGCRYELLPNTGRYYFIPVLPYPTNENPVEGVDLVRIGELTELDDVTRIFDSRYEDEYSGDAWMVRIGNSLFVTNSHENVDQAQTYGVLLDGDLESLSGRVQPHAYLLGSIGTAGDHIWLHANAEHGPEYTDDRTTVVQMEWSDEPTFTVTPSSALMEWSWDAGRLSLVLSHENGAVEVVASLTATTTAVSPASDPGNPPPKLDPKGPDQPHR